jgi:hypothetical protein
MNQFTKLFSAKTFFFNAALVALAHTANAHPGHPMLDHGTAHVVTSPYHLLILATIGIALLAGAQIVQSRWAQRCLRVAGFGAVIVAGLLSAIGH